MRKLCMIVFNLLLLDVAAGLAQEQVLPFLAQNKQMTAQSRLIPGSHLLWKDAQVVREYLALHPNLQEQMRLRKSSAWNFKVGDTKSWSAFNFSTSQNYQVPATCRAVGINCYIFVENAIWNINVIQRSVDSIRVAFDQRTPAFSNKGVYQADVEAFGTPPDIDNDPKIIILILDIKDNFSTTGSGVAGYFSPRDQTNLPNSNQAEIYYLDANPIDLTDPALLAYAVSTTAHEFQHMIHFRYDTDEATFINEGCSLVAEVHCGYSIFPQSGFVNETNIYLLNFRTALDPNVDNDYSRAARFMTYIRDQVGIGFFKLLVQSPLNGTFGIDAALQALGSALRFNDIFKNWVIANILDDKTVNPAYGYTYPNLPKVVGRLLGDPNVPTTTSSVQNLGAEYLSFKFGANLKAKFTVENPSILIKAVEIGPASKRVLDVTPNVDFTEPDYGTTYKEIHFVVFSTSQAFPYGYTYQATGTTKPAELKWDGTEPAGFLRLAVSDTQCVTFDALPGGKLDSIRVALRRAGAITGGVWQFTENLRPTPLGKRLAFPITASTNLTPPVINPGGEAPYPIPYPNWRKVDLGSFNIKTDQPFAVAFIIRVPDTPAVMITRYPGQNPYHSFTYLHSPSGGGTPNWYYLTADASNIWIYLIRAYVSFLTTGVKQIVELEPRAFYLAQNYPNPFNPNTTIEFSLPRASKVTLKVFNALGEEVATLLHEKRPAGKYNLVWNANNVPSGVYFYRLEGEGFVETKRLVLMK